MKPEWSSRAQDVGGKKKEKDQEKGAWGAMEEGERAGERCPWGKLFDPKARKQGCLVRKQLA